MALSKPANGVVFAEPSLEKAFNELAENSPLKNSIRNAIKNIKENIFTGDQIQKYRIPKEYIKKYKINNLWWYPLANAWRLVYSITNSSDIEVLAVIIKYCDHKEYERIFHY